MKSIFFLCCFHVKHTDNIKILFSYELSILKTSFFLTGTWNFLVWYIQKMNLFHGRKKKVKFKENFDICLETSYHKESNCMKLKYSPAYTKHPRKKRLKIAPCHHNNKVIWPCFITNCFLYVNEIWFLGRNEFRTE